MDPSGREALGAEWEFTQLVQSGFHRCSGWENCVFNPVHWSSLEGNMVFCSILSGGQAAFVEQMGARRDSRAGAIAAA